MIARRHTPDGSFAKAGRAKVEGIRWLGCRGARRLPHRRTRRETRGLFMVLRRHTSYGRFGRLLFPYMVRTKSSERRELNPRHPPWQGGALPLSYSRVPAAPSGPQFRRPELREKGLEPLRPKAPDPKSGVSANFTTLAKVYPPTPPAVNDPSPVRRMIPVLVLCVEP